VKGRSIQAAGDTRQNKGKTQIEVLAAIIAALDQHSVKPPPMANALLPVLETPEQGLFRVLRPVQEIEMVDRARGKTAENLPFPALDHSIESRRTCTPGGSSIISANVQALLPAIA